MAPSITYVGVDPNDYEVRVTISGEDFGEEFTAQIDNMPNVLTLLKIKPKPVATAAKAANAGSTGTGEGAGNADLACQFCGNEVTGTSFNGKTFSAVQIANGRAQKMGRMGKKAAPVCGKCWSRGGHAQAWEQFYAANK